MKSKVSPSPTLTSANGPRTTGDSNPRISLRNSADFWLSRAATIVWFNFTVMSLPISGVGRVRLSRLVGWQRGPGKDFPPGRDAFDDRCKRAYPCSIETSDGRGAAVEREGGSRMLRPMSVVVGLGAAALALSGATAGSLTSAE